MNQTNIWQEKLDELKKLEVYGEEEVKCDQCGTKLDPPSGVFQRFCNRKCRKDFKNGQRKAVRN